MLEGPLGACRVEAVVGEWQRMRVSNLKFNAWSRIPCSCLFDHRSAHIDSDNGSGRSDSVCEGAYVVADATTDIQEPLTDARLEEVLHRGLFRRHLGGDIPEVGSEVLRSIFGVDVAKSSMNPGNCIAHRTRLLRRGPQHQQP